MSDRIEMSFKNKEIRMWAYIMVPTVIVGSILILRGNAIQGFDYRFVNLLLLLISQAIYYTWRFQYRKKQNAKPM